MTLVLAHMMDRDDMGGGHWWGWLIALGVLAVIVILVVWAVTRMTQSHSTPAATSQPYRPPAEDLLAERFARGEIDEDEFRRRRDALRQ